MVVLEVVVLETYSGNYTKDCYENCYGGVSAMLKLM